MISAWHEKLAQYQTLYVGFSGGLDSTVLLHQLRQYPDLAAKLVAIHVNHGLSVNATNWQSHCEKICQEWQISFKTVAVHLDDTHNIEQQARDARYQVFKSHVGVADALLLAHHRDDQAETVLLQLCRGTGVYGLAAMPAIRSFADGVLIRPLLECDRDALYQYASTHAFTWIEDESNQDTRFSRNYIRHEVMPVLRKRWPKVVQNISDCAKICQLSRKNLEFLADMDLKKAQQDANTLDLSALCLEDTARVLNVLYVWLQRQSVPIPNATHLDRLLNEVILAREDAEPMLTWQNVCIRRYRNKLYLEKSSICIKDVSAAKEDGKEITLWKKFPEPIAWYGGTRLIAVAAEQGIVVPKNACIEIRTRQGGERFRLHGQNKSLKKLFQTWGVPPWKRNHIPLIYVNNQLKVIVGYAQADDTDFIKKVERFTINYDLHALT